METLIHADAFFFISTIGFILVLFLVLVILLYVLQIARDIKSVFKKFKDEGGALLDDAKIFRDSIMKRKDWILAFLSSVLASRQFGIKKKKKD